MKTSLSIGLLCGLSVTLIGTAVLLADGPAGPQDAKRRIAVRLASGRTFTAELDTRTDASLLYLRWRQGSASILRPIQWDRVVRVHVAGGQLSGGEFHELVKQWRRDVPVRPEEAAIRNRPVFSSPPDPGQSAPAASDAPQREPETPRVRSLAIEAVIANWDADVENDGLLVYVYPLDAGGAIVPVRGTVEVELTGERTGIIKRAQPFRRVGRWTRRVRFEDFGPDGAVVRLAFQSVHPEFDLEYAPHGAVGVRLSVPGQGTFETTASTVRIRPYSVVRDQLQHATGRRFFGHERTGAGRR